MDYNEMLKHLARLRKEYKINPDVPKPTITSTGGALGVNFDFSSLYPSTMFKFGGFEDKRILKIKKILENVDQIRGKG
jgi:hypothetical protein